MIVTRPSPLSTKCLDSSNSYRKQIGLAHEPGHVIDYLIDEYNTGDSDPSALMSIGLELRPRYMILVTTNLNKMIYDTKPSIKEVLK